MSNQINSVATGKLLGRLSRGAVIASLATLGCAGADDAKDGDTVAVGTGPVYALLAITFNPDDSATSYVVLSDTPDLRRVSLTGAREFGGRQNIATAYGQLYVGSYDEPTVSRFSFSDSLEWRDEGVVSFANQGVHEGRLESLVNPKAAYTPVSEFEPLRVVWDPTGLAVVSSQPESTVALEKEGLSARFAGYDFAERQGPPMRTVMYDDGDMFEIAPTTTVVVYDPKTHEEKRTFEVPCPGMFQGAEDEAGNTYLSSIASPALALYGGIQGSCVMRIKRDGTLDDAWHPDVTQWTEGRQVASVDYLHDGLAIGSVLHHEELEALGADFGGPFDDEVFTESQNGNHYRPWLFDLVSETAQPIAGVTQGVAASPVVIDGRTFLNVSYDEWSRTQMYEINADGTAELRFEVPAYVESWVRIR